METSVIDNDPNTRSVTMMDFPLDNSMPTPTPLTPQEDEKLPDGSLFFADATLDLDEAHDIAETPEPQKLPSSLVQTAEAAVELPNLTTSDSSSQPSQPSQVVANHPLKMFSSSTAMNRITNSDEPSGPSAPMPTSRPTYRPKPPRRPRDIPWLVAFFLFVPFPLLFCAMLRSNIDYGSNVALSKRSVWASFYCLVLAFGATIVLSRLLYRTMGGGDGDDARHIASQVILAFAPILLAVNSLLMLCIFFKAPKATAFAIIPLAFIARDLWAMRQWRTTASTAGGRQAFFQAITNMALDVLSRSLRRSSFFRVVVAVLGLQFIVVWWWRVAFLGALGHGYTFWIIVSFVAGKWATGTVARVLGLVASGGVTTWFVQQSIIMEEMEKLKASQQSPPTTEESITNGASSNMPEEYRMVDASAYQPVLDMDDGIDDDYEDDDVLQIPDKSLWQDTNNSTVRAFLVSSLTVSFGSVAQCGLLGGFAQFVWSVLRNLQAVSTDFSRRFASSSRLGFQGMQIGSEGSDGGTQLGKILGRGDLLARNFVRNHTDLAMCQVAAYYKSYQRAAQDVAVLVDGSGVEPIIHDDITTHMCACVCGAVSGIIVMFVGLILAHHKSPGLLGDVTIVQSMLMSFVLCYTLLFTVMEPLRASIKAIYVCFAQHPQSLRQSFPLIFHRLNRISEANLV